METMLKITVTEIKISPNDSTADMRGQKKIFSRLGKTDQ